jgi:hypothetical protein
MAPQAPPAEPTAEDIVIRRMMNGLFAVAMTSGPPQLQCPTFEEALASARSVTSEQRVRLWLTEDDRTFVLLADERLLRRVWDEYVEMPGLRLTRDQARRLWGVDESTCTQLLDNLVTAHVLVCGRDGRYSCFARMAKAGIAPRTAPHLRQVS